MSVPRRRIEGRILPDPRPKTVSLVWRLDSFYSLIPIGGSYLFGGPSFFFLDAEWWLLISPTTTREPDAPLMIALGLQILPDSSTTRNVFYKLGIRGSDGTEIVSDTKKMEFVSDILCLASVLRHVTTLSRQDRDLYLPGGDLTVFATIWAAGETREAACQMEGPQGVRGLLRDLKTLFLSGTDTDFLLKVGGRQFGVHKTILGARSPVFAAMLQHDMSERRSSVVEIADCDPEAFGDFLAYLYSGTAEDLSRGKVLHLYRAADKYEVADLKAECVEFIQRNLSMDVFFDVAALALTHDDTELLLEVVLFFAKNLEAIAGSGAWHTFLQENPVAGRELYTKALEQRGVVELKGGQSNA